MGKWDSLILMNAMRWSTVETARYKTKPIGTSG
jgi:hypothetical protein